MKRLLVIASVLFIIAPSWATAQPFAKLSEPVLRQFLLTPDGENVNVDFLQELVLKLVRLNQIAGINEISFTTPLSEDTTPALDKYLTEAGKRPSTSQTLDLSAACDVCASAINVVGPLLVSDRVWPVIHKTALLLCPIVTGFPRDMCQNYVNKYAAMAQYTLRNLVKSPYTLCGKFLKRLGCGAPDHPHSMWLVPIPDRLPNPVALAQADATTKDTLMVFYITDIHLDPEYEPGSIAECTEPLCCRSTSTLSKDTFEERDKAGYWGDYRRCDLPLWTLDDMLRHANDTHGNEIDFIMLGGDIMSHDSFDVDPEKNSRIIKLVADKISERLPGIPFYFTVGNHEVTPCDGYALPGDPEEFSTQWLYDTFADVWEKWLDPNTTDATIRKAGFFTTLLKPGWRLISLNNNFCYDHDWFLWARDDITDPYDELHWLVATLTEAEKNGERVQILAHIQPGDGSCLQVWSYNYYRIIDRFAHIITGQFHGHAHDDHFAMYFDAETLSQPKAVAFVGPPGTPYGRNNIGYRLYEFDAKTFTLLDYRQYYADILAENERENKMQMTWNFEYSAKAEYGLDDMSPESYAYLLKQMQSNKTLFDRYRQHYTLSLTYEMEPCGIKCRRRRLCEAYQGLSKTGGALCEHFFPSTQTEDLSKRKCSARFIKLAEPRTHGAK